MSGTKYFFDTNAIIALLMGNSFLNNLLVQTDWIATSVINGLEFLSFSDLSETDRKVFYEFISRITVIPVSDKDRSVLEIIAEIRISKHLKLPDAIIAGTAIYNDAVLITNDKVFSKIPLLKTESF